MFQTFDIFPLFGSLEPGTSMQMLFTFYGHAFLARDAVAMCEVEKGPTYEVCMKGQASVVQYNFSLPYIDFGRIVKLILDLHSNVVHGVCL